MGVKIEIELSNEMIERIADKIILKKKHNIIDERKEEIYTVEKVANIIKKSTYTIRRHIKLGILKAERPGKSYIITYTNLNNYINGKNDSH